MSDLVSRLLEAIAKREAAATAACHGGSGRWLRPNPDRYGQLEDEEGEVVVYDEGRPSEAQFVLIEMHDPQSVLRLCQLLADEFDHGAQVCEFALGRAVKALARGYGIEDGETT